MIDGKHDAQFVVDIFQTGSGTSTNMNANEVIANRAIEIATGRRAAARSRSIPTITSTWGKAPTTCSPPRCTSRPPCAIDRTLIPALQQLHDALDDKGRGVGRHRQDRPHASAGRDADPPGPGVRRLRARRSSSASSALEARRSGLRELPLGGTAVGTGINTHPEFAKRAIEVIAENTGIALSSRRRTTSRRRPPRTRSSKRQRRSSRRSPSRLTKIANDIRWLASGPRCGIGEISFPRHPAGQLDHAGQSQPGDVRDGADGRRPGDRQRRDHHVRRPGSGSTFELNVMMPVIALKLLEAIEFLTNVITP